MFRERQREIRRVKADDKRGAKRSEPEAVNVVSDLELFGRIKGCNYIPPKTKMKENHA